MNRFLIFSVFLLSLTGLYSCSAKYSANPNSLVNNSSNPINQNPTYNWTGTDPISATVNGVPWVADPSSLSIDFTSPGYFIFAGSVGGKQIMRFWYNNVWPGNTYRMGINNGSQYIIYYDSASVPAKFAYQSILAVWGSGGTKIILNDTFAYGVPGYIKGLFFFEGVDSVGRVINVSNGYFNVRKW